MKIIATLGLLATLVVWLLVLIGVGASGGASQFNQVAANAYRTFIWSYPIATLLTVVALWLKPRFEVAGPIPTMISITTVPFLILAIAVGLAGLYGYFTKAELKVFELDLTSITLPATYHEELPYQQQVSRDELKAPVEDRLRRRLYFDTKLTSKHHTAYLFSHDYQTIGGRKLPLILRVSVSRDFKDQSINEYFAETVTFDFHGTTTLTAPFAEIQPSLSVGENPTETHFIVTNPEKTVRLFLTADKAKLSRADGIEFIKAAIKTAAVKNERSAAYFKAVDNFVANQDAILEQNFKLNLEELNSQLKTNSLSAVLDEGLLTDAGATIYGVFGYKGDRRFWLGVRSQTVARSESKAAMIRPPRADGDGFVAWTAVLEYPHARPSHTGGLTYETGNLYLPTQDADLVDIKAVVAAQNENSGKPAKSWNLGRVGPQRTGTSIASGEGFNFLLNTARFAAGKPPNFAFVDVTYVGRAAEPSRPDQLVYWLRAGDESKFLSVEADKEISVEDSIQNVKVRLNLKSGSSETMSIELL